jgi:hypothetical protein
MTTLAAGASVSFTIPTGQVATVTGTGIAVPIYPLGSPIALTGNSVIGPFNYPRLINMTASSSVDYVVDVLPTQGTGPTASLGITAKPVVGAVAAGNIATASFTAIGIPTPTTAVQWLLNDVVISGATATSYQSQASDSGKQLKARFTATNTFGSITSTSDAVTVSTGQTPSFSAPTVSSLALAGFGATDVTLSSTTGTATNRIKAFNNGVEDVNVIDVSTSPTASVRRVKGQIPGVSYTYQNVATSTTGDTATSPSSSALAQPTISVGKILTNKGISYYLPALTASDNLATGETLHMQMTLEGSEAIQAGLEVFLVNASKVQDSVAKVSISYSAVAGGAVPVGSAPGVSNQETMNNTGTWSTPVTVTIPMSTATRGDSAPGIVSIGNILRATLAPLARTDFVGAPIIVCIRAYFAAGTSRTFANMVPNNGLGGASIDYEMSKPDPAVSVLGGRLLRSYRQTGVDGVTSVTNMTANGAVFKPDVALACFVIQTLTGNVGHQVVVNGDSRASFAKSSQKAGAGVHRIAQASSSTLAAPVFLANLGGDGFGPQLWLDRVNSMVGYFTNTPLVFLPLNSINGFGAGPSIVNYDSNAALIDQVKTAWVNKGCRLIRESTLGVDPSSPNYQWGTSDQTSRHDKNIILEDASTFAAPAIAIATLTEGSIAANGMYNQNGPGDSNLWVELGSGDGTKAHFNYAWALYMSKYYTPFYKA